jgi:hypothetical protein
MSCPPSTAMENKRGREGDSERRGRGNVGVEGRCPLVGHLLLILVSLGLGGAIQLQH